VNSSLYANPRLYDAQYATLSRDRAFYAALAREAGGPVLELAAGTGRLSEAMLEAGAEVVAVEISRPMLGEARRRLARFGDRVRLAEGDFRAFDLGRRFPLAVCGFNSLCHADPAGFAAALGCVRRHLAGGGRFALDLPNPGARDRGPFLRERFYDEAAGEACEVWETLEPDADPRAWRRRWDYRWAGGRRAVETLRRWEYAEGEVRGMLGAAGFRVESLAGDFAGTAFGPASRRQVWAVSPGTGRGSGPGGA
jgi:SAM-dependent methyltransferase